jgi:phosphoglycerol transferase MdoB-like AlkP superfamily enzyme
MALAISRSRPASWLSGPLRRGACGVMLTALAAIAARGTLDHRPISPSAAAISTNRVANEIAGSGLYTVIYELWRRARGDVVRLAEVQPTLPAAEAQARVRRMREARAPLPTAPLGIRNVVVVVMESMTGRLVGALEGQPALTPELDVLAAEGLLLTHCYATGERTVQGLEAVLASFPPLPGVSVIRRPEAQSGFATLGSVMEQHGYDTLFLYGGQGIFDHMRSFFLGNGFTRFIEERDFDAPAFRTSWGVSDNDLFRRANREFQARWQSGRPFLAAILTVSLHSPWERPPGFASHLPEDAEVPEGFEREELESFLYADHAIGEFVREARRLDYFYDTLFVFVGDHGVHLRGRALVPSEEYRVPALFLAPGRLAPGRIDEVTSQLDLAPTILGMLGLPPDPHFFGRDLRSTASESGLAVLVYRKQHYAARRGRRLRSGRAGAGPPIAWSPRRRWSPPSSTRRTARMRTMRWRCCRPRRRGSLRPRAMR